MLTRSQASLSFVFKMTLREIRASWKRLVFFFICVAIGVGAIVGVRSIIQSARDALLRESRALLAADVLVESREPWTEEVRAIVNARLGTVPVLDRIESVEAATMARPAESAKAVAKRVELRGGEPGLGAIRRGRRFPRCGLVGGKRFGLRCARW